MVIVAPELKGLEWMPDTIAITEVILLIDQRLGKIVV